MVFFCWAKNKNYDNTKQSLRFQDNSHISIIFLLYKYPYCLNLCKIQAQIDIRVDNKLKLFKTLKLSLKFYLKTNKYIWIIFI